jgi:putative heme iron utilization protein
MTRRLDEETFGSIRDHMNEDHADTLILYALVFGGVSDADSARMVALDELGMDLAVESASGPRMARISFPHRLADADDARQTLIAMARGVTPGS